MRSTPTISPLMAPQAAPTASVTARPAPRLIPSTFITYSAVVTARAKVEPTDRSMPPEIMTIDRPSTTSPSSATCWERLARVPSSKNLGTMEPKIAITSTSAMKGIALSTHFLFRTSPTT